MYQGAASQRAKMAYQSSQVQMEDPMGLIVRLYDGMLGFLRQGAARLDAGDKIGAAEPIRRATDIVGELQGVLDLERGGEIAANLDRLYGYCRRRILEAHLAAQADGLEEVARLMAPLRDAWAEARTKQMEPAS